VTAFVSAVIAPAENVLFNRAALRERIQKIWARAEKARLEAEPRTASGYARDSPPGAGTRKTARAAYGWDARKELGAPRIGLKATPVARIPGGH